MNKVIARLCEIFSLAAEATEDQILAKLNEHYAAAQQLSAARDRVVAVLGVKPEAPDAEIEGTLAAAVKAQTLRGKVVAALKLDANASDEAIVAAITTAQSSAGELAALAAKVAELQQKEFERTFASVIDEAFQAGKILPVQKNDSGWMETQRNFAKANPTEFTAFWSKQPIIGPMLRIPDTHAAARSGGFSEDDLRIAKILHIDEATLTKYNPTPS